MNIYCYKLCDVLIRPFLFEFMILIHESYIAKHPFIKDLSIKIEIELWTKEKNLKKKMVNGRYEKLLNKYINKQNKMNKWN